VPNPIGGPFQVEQIDNSVFTAVVLRHPPPEPSE
jgi:hypothetical protein